MRRLPKALWLRWTDFSQSNLRFSMLFLVILLIICSAAVFIGAVPTWHYGHDDFFLLDNGWRIICGQRPHLDFFSPWGPVTFLVVGMGLTLADFSVNGIGYGNAVIGLIIGLWSFWLTRGRLAPAFRFILCIYLTLLVTAPYSLGIHPFMSSHAMLYNRYGYALLGLILVECFYRKGDEEHDTREILDGISTGTITAIVLFLKASYFFVCLLPIIVSFLLGRHSFKRIFGLAVGFCIVLVSMLAYLNFDILSLYDAYRMAAGARSTAFSLLTLAVQFISQMPTILIVIGIAYLAMCSNEGKFSWMSNHYWLLWLLIITAMDSMLMLSNAQLYVMPLLGVFAVMIMNQLIIERQHLAIKQSRIEFPRHLFLNILFALLIIPLFVLNFVGMANGIFQKIHASRAIGMARFTEPHLTSLLLYDDKTLISSNGSVYTNYVNNGVSLLRKHCNASDRVLTMDMVNPFPYALKWKPPRGGIAATSFNFTLSKQHRPSFDAYFGDATVVLLPKHPAQIHRYIDGFYALYIPALLERYQLYAESDWFWLYRRKMS